MRTRRESKSHLECGGTRETPIEAEMHSASPDTWWRPTQRCDRRCQLRSLHSAMVQEKCTSLESVISRKEKEKRKCCTLVGGLESYGHGNRMKCLKRVQAAQCGVIRCAHAVFCVASSIFSPWLQKKYMERTPLETLYRFRSRRGLRGFAGRSSRVF